MSLTLNFVFPLGALECNLLRWIQLHQLGYSCALVDRTFISVHNLVCNHLQYNVPAIDRGCEKAIRYVVHNVG